MLNRLFSRRAVVTSAAAATAAVVPAVAAASRVDADPADMEGMAAFNIDGRRLLVDTNRVPKPGDEVVAIVPELTGQTPRLEVFRAFDRGNRFIDRPLGDRTVLRADPPRYVAAMGETIQQHRYCTCIGVVVGAA